MKLKEEGTMKVTCKCAYCGKEFEREACCIKGRKHLFCCRDCQHKFCTKKFNPECYDTYADHSKARIHMRELALKYNPTRMTPEVRAKVRASRLNKGEGKTYTKIYGVHAHRVVAEEMLGRKLKPDEVVHHIDGNKRNNEPSNLKVFENQAEHARFHVELKQVLKMLNS